MSQDRPPAPARPPHVPPPSARQLAPAAALWAVPRALGLAILFALWLVIEQVAVAEVEPPSLLAVAVRAAVAFVLLVAVFLSARLVWLSRPVADRAFAGMGLAATWFGLIMLLVFFASLAFHSARWFQVIPQLTREENARLEKVRDMDATATIEKELHKVHREMEDRIKTAKTDQEKEQIRRLYEDRILPFKRHDLEKTVQEQQIAAAKSIRADTSPLANLGYFLTAGPSNVPQDAGIYPALLGSLWIGLLTLFFAVPIGVGAALYLEEYRPRGWLGALIQVNINNLAGVPSIVYGLLGAFLFVELIFKPIEQHVNPAVAARNVLGGGLTLGLLSLPMVIVAAQEAIRAVPASIREGAYALGATRWQVIRRSILPLASPGILTGTILAVSRAIGEAAPLVLFGALLFVNQKPGLFSRFTVLPLQIFGWADRPAVTVDGEPVAIWEYNAALASIILLILLLGLNAGAIYLRNRSQVRNPP
jgi:phosphate transport system permease protein